MLFFVIPLDGEDNQHYKPNWKRVDQRPKLAVNWIAVNRELETALVEVESLDGTEDFQPFARFYRVLPITPQNARAFYAADGVTSLIAERPHIRRTLDKDRDDRAQRLNRTNTGGNKTDGFITGDPRLRW